MTDKPEEDEFYEIDLSDESSETITTPPFLTVEEGILEEGNFYEMVTMATADSLEEKLSKNSELLGKFIGLAMKKGEEGSKLIVVLFDKLEKVDNSAKTVAKSVAGMIDDPEYKKKIQHIQDALDLTKSSAENKRGLWLLLDIVLAFFGKKDPSKEYAVRKKIKEMKKEIAQEVKTVSAKKDKKAKLSSKNHSIVKKIVSL